MKPFRMPQFRSWPLWLTWLAFIGVLIAEHFAGLSAAGHQVAEIAIVVFFIGLLGWLAAAL